MQHAHAHAHTQVQWDAVFVSCSSPSPFSSTVHSSPPQVSLHSQPYSTHTCTLTHSCFDRAPSVCSELLAASGRLSSALPVKNKQRCWSLSILFIFFCSNKASKCLLKVGCFCTLHSYDIANWSWSSLLIADMKHDSQCYHTVADHIKLNWRIFEEFYFKTESKMALYLITDHQK